MRERIATKTTNGTTNRRECGNLFKSVRTWVCGFTRSLCGVFEYRLAR